MQKELSKYIKKTPKISNTLGTFEIKEQLGQGRTSVVRRLTLEDNKEYAIKFLLENIINSESKAYKRFKQAHINMLSIQNTGAVLPQIHFDNLIINKTITIPYIIMLKAEKTLSDFKKEKEITFEIFESIFNSMIILLKTIHSNHIIHRDLKPENIFILNSTLVLGDFDIAKFNDNNHIKLHDTIGKERLANYLFSAPEQSEKSFDDITNTADLYAFGQILYWLIKDKTLRGQAKINFKDDDKRLIKYEPVISKLLQNEPKERFQNTDEILTFLKHSNEEYNNYLEHSKQFITLKIFEQIIDKYTFELHWKQFKSIHDNKDINNIMQDLSMNIDKLSLWWSQGRADNNYEDMIKNHGLSPFSKIREKFIPSNKWILDSFEIDIKSIWIYKYGDIGGSIIIIESKAMPSFGISKNTSDIEEVALFQNRYISRAHYDNGWTKYKGKKTKIENAIPRIRYLKKNIFFITPYAGPIIGNDHSNSSEVIYKIYKKYESGIPLSESLLEPLKTLRRKPEIAMLS